MSAAGSKGAPKNPGELKDDTSSSREEKQAVPDPGHVTVKFTDLTLQTFPPAEAQGKISSGSRPPHDVDGTFSKPGPDSEEPHIKMSWIGLKILFFHSEEVLLKRLQPTRICMDHSGYALP